MVVEVGLTVIEDPVPMEEPVPQPPAYHTRLDPVPAVPPEAVSVVGPPAQIGLALAETPVGAVEFAFTVTVMDAHPVGVPQPPSRRT